MEPLKPISNLLNFCLSSSSLSLADLEYTVENIVSLVLSFMQLKKEVAELTLQLDLARSQLQNQLHVVEEERSPEAEVCSEVTRVSNDP